MESIGKSVERRTFHTLDGLRGVAALAVVLFHLKLFKPLALPSGYLAVDLFFLMSGVVIAHAYEKKLRSGLTVGRFFAIRWIRLLPLYLVGSGLGAATVGAALVFGSSQDWTWATFVPAAAAAALLLPNFMPASKALLYPFNLPAWSLFWELAVNLAYAMLAPMLGRRTLWAIVIISGAALLAVCVGYGTLDYGSKWSGWPVGLARVIFSFSLGVVFARLLERGRLFVMPRIPAPVLLLIAVAIFALPTSLGWTKDALVVLIVFPLMVMSAIQVQPRGVRFYTFLGLISYPIYTIHVSIHAPLISAKAMALGGKPAVLISDVLVFAGLILASWVLAKWYDPFARATLTQALLHRRQRPVAIVSLTDTSDQL